MCVYHLLKNKIFSKHRVDVGEWVWSQITQADEPIHYLLPALIEEWVKRYPIRRIMATLAAHTLTTRHDTNTAFWRPQRRSA
jgi:hypothetical protein